MADIYSLAAIPDPAEQLIEEGLASDGLLAFHEDIVQKHNMLAQNLISLGTTTGADINIDFSRAPLKTYVNNGAHALIPGPNDGVAVVDIINGTNAGVITLSGWNKITGGSFTTVPGAIFRCFISSINGVSLLNVDLEGGGGGGSGDMLKAVYDPTGVNDDAFLMSNMNGSTTNLSEGTNLYFTQVRVSANTNVIANTAKVSAGLFKIDSGTVSNDAFLTIENLSSLFISYELKFWNLVPQVDSRAFRLQTRESPTTGAFDAGATDYVYVRHMARANDTTIDINGNNGNSIMQMTFSDMAIETTKPASGTIELINPLDPTRTQIRWNLGFRNSGVSSNITHVEGTGARDANVAIGSFRVFFDSGNINTMDWALYGTLA